MSIFRQPTSCGTLCIATFIAALIAVPFWSSQAPPQAAGPPIVRAAGGSLVSGTPGPTVALPIKVVNVQGLGATTILVGYDPASLKVVACQRGPSFDVGLCNSAYDRNADGTPDAVLFNVVSLQGVNATTAPVVLVNITWQAVTAVPETRASTLSVQVQTFTDTDGNPLAHTAQDGQITLLPAPTHAHRDGDPTRADELSSLAVARALPGAACADSHSDRDGNDTAHSHAITQRDGHPNTRRPAHVHVQQLVYAGWPDRLVASERDLRPAGQRLAGLHQFHSVSGPCL